MKYKHILAGIFFSTLSVATISAQSIIGGTASDLKDFSVLQVEGTTGGIRLPRITNAEKASLATTLGASAESAGLTIFNSDTGVIEFWDGTGWVSLSGAGAVSAGNGVTKAGNVLKLGGTLVEDTNIETTATENLAFTTNNGSFAVNRGGASQLLVKNDSVVMKTGGFSVDNVLKVNASAVSIAADKFSVNDAVVMDANGVTLADNLAYKDGNQGQSYVLTTDSKGNASWEALRTLGTVSSVPVNPSWKGPDGEWYFWNDQASFINSEPLTLLPGQWMVFAKVGTSTAQIKEGDIGKALWIDMFYTRPGDPRPEVNNVGDVNKNVLRVTGVLQERKTAGGTYSTPNFMQYLNVKETTNFYARISTSIKGGNQMKILKPGQDSWLGENYFYALRIDIADKDSDATAEFK